MTAHQLFTRCEESSLIPWLDENADDLDSGGPAAGELLSKLADSGVFRAGIPEYQGGSGSAFTEAVAAIAKVSERSLTAGFVSWGHRTFIEYLLTSPNKELAEKWLPDLLSGRLAGATALSNAMKYLSGIEAIQIKLTQADKAEGYSPFNAHGHLFWVTNLDPKGFLVAAIAEREDEKPPAIILLNSRAKGVIRSDNLKLAGLRGSATAAIEVKNAAIGEKDIIHPDATAFCPSIRPRFLGLQCGMSVGLARASLNRVRERAESAKGGYLIPPLEALEAELSEAYQTLVSGLESDQFARTPALLFRVRIQLADIVQRAANLELEATGGFAYLLDQHTGFERRWREAAFIPVVTPSVSQLKGELAKQARHTP
jgi:alkylation response protein AidB-like acyl-CoA dehydrogenase